MNSLFVPARRAQPARVVEATPEQLAAAGAVGSYGRDPVDGDTGYVLAGSSNRSVPPWTQEKSRAYSVAAYRLQPMAKAIIDTYSAFCVGDSGVRLQISNPDVLEVAEAFWNDPRNNLGAVQDVMLRDLLINGEQLHEMLVGPSSGTVRFSPVNTTAVEWVENTNGNPMWPYKVHFAQGPEGNERSLVVASVNDETGLREGNALWWTPWKTVLSDTRSMPFLSSILDWLDNHDNVLSNLQDRTALARYLVWDVTVQGGQAEVDAFISARGGQQIPRSGSIEVHNQSVTWEPKSAPSGAAEDTQAAGAMLTQIAGGAGLAKHWLAEPEATNRATGLTMAEPVRRRVAGVQALWLGYMTEMVRYAVDQAVAVGRLPKTVTSTDATTGREQEIPTAMAVHVVGPEIAAADASITATTLMNLSTGIKQLVGAGAMTVGAAQVAVRKAWSDYVGVPYTHDLDEMTADDVAQQIATAQGQPAGGGVGPKVPAPPGASDSPSSPAAEGWEPDLHPRDDHGHFTHSTVGHLARGLRHEIAARHARGTFPAGARSFAELPAGTQKGLLDAVRGDDTSTHHLDAAVAHTDAWLAAGGVSGLRTNLDDENLTAGKYKAGVAAFNARAAELGALRSTPASRRLGAAMREQIVSDIVSGDLPWDARALSKRDRDGVLAQARDRIGMTNTSTQGGNNAGDDLVKPVDVAAMASTTDWLAHREIPPVPPATAATHHVAARAKTAIVAAINDGRFDRGNHAQRNRQRAIPTSWATLRDGPEFVAAGHAADGSTPDRNRPLQLADKPVVDELDSWLAAGMPGADVQRELPADDLERSVRANPAIYRLLPHDLRAQLPADLRGET